ncbi:hypothetical protein [Nitrosovibrio tenuis]|uniref:Uncharacterized protein n=1 Tax=Nitrosovibrio tenuis TaxID=1233 RepID=A0A1H7H0K1_9PROT|nr:hypothetical protein [Nitrosovibrio tenuis]SEK42460.1 hypothetical protein SAMN05216387_101405 [Nitrosovibrio tenuis]
MVNYIHSIRAVPALLIVAVTVTIGVGAPVLAYAAATEQTGNTGQAGNTSQKANDERRKIGEANDLKLKARDPLYAEQAKSLAAQYKETAEIVARQGGNPQPILDAAAQLEGQSEVVSKARQNKNLSIQIPEPAAHSHSHNK